MWQCPKCETNNTSDCCVICGEKKPQIKSGNQQQQTAQTQRVTNTYYTRTNSPAVKRNNAPLIVLCIVLAITVVVASILVVLLLSNDDYAVSRSDNTPTETASPTPQTEEEPEYGIYVNDEYNLSCAYPKNFTEIAPDGYTAIKAYVSKDKTAKMRICASKNTDGTSVSSALEEFHSVFGGTVTYQATGDTWYAVSIKNGDRCLYRKCFVKNGKVSCMDFECNEQDIDIYSSYIEYIEDNYKMD